VINDLTNIADHDSFSVDGVGNAKLLIVQCALDRYREIQTSDPVRDLRSQIRNLQAEKNAREQEVAILKGFGKSMAQNPDLTPDQAKAFSDTLFDKVLACAETVRDIDEKMLQLNLKINKIQNTRFGALFTRVVITIVTDEDGPVQLRLTYREEDNIEEKKKGLPISYPQVCSTLVGTRSTTYTQLQKAENHPHPSLFTTSSTSGNARERIGPTPN